MIDVQPFLDELERYDKMLAWKIFHGDQYGIPIGSNKHLTPDDIEKKFGVKFSVTPKVVQITRCHNHNSWYYQKVGQLFDVVEVNEKHKWYKVITGITPRLTETGFGIILFENAKVVR